MGNRIVVIGASLTRRCRDHEERPFTDLPLQRARLEAGERCGFGQRKDGGILVTEGKERLLDFAQGGPWTGLELLKVGTVGFAGDGGGRGLELERGKFGDGGG